MTRFSRLTSAFCLMVCALPAGAQDERETPLSPEDFRAEVERVGNEAGTSRLPVTCGGLFRAMRSLAEDGSDLHETFGKQEKDMAFYAVAMHRKATGATDTDTSLDFVVPHMRNISTLYLKRMSRNRKATGALLDDQIRADFNYCRDLNTRLGEAVKK